MEVFATSDLHFGHAKIIEYENRPYKDVDEMDKKLIENWNDIVKEKDLVYILGDFSWYNGENTNKILKKLNGRKILIVGNHDERFLKDKKFDKTLFDEICEYKQIKYNKKVYVLFHYPIAEHNGKMHGYIHLYGHIHSTNLQLEHELGVLCHNVGVDRNNYRPVNIRKYEV